MRYTSDLTDTQWELVRPLLGKTRNRKYDKRELVNAVLYVVKTGCQWRNLPKDFPEWNAVYHFYSRAMAKGVWEGWRMVMPRSRHPKKEIGRASCRERV